MRRVIVMGGDFGDIATWCGVVSEESDAVAQYFKHFEGKVPPDERSLVVFEDERSLVDAGLFERIYRRGSEFLRGY